VVAGLCLVGLVIAAAVLQTATSGLPKRTGIPYIQPPLVQSGIAETLRLPPAVASGPAPIAATNGDLPEINQPLQVIQLLSGGRLVVYTMSFDNIPLQHANGGVPVLPDTSVRGRADLGPPGETWFDVTRFGAGEALVAARQLRNGHLRVTVLALRQGLPRLWVTVVPAPLPTGSRTVAVATWTPPVPDLFVVDQGTARRTPVVVRIYSGENRFHKLSSAHVVPVFEPGKAARRGWVWDVARIQGGQRPDLVLVKRRGLSGKPEVHVLAGDSLFGTFFEHLAIPGRPI